MTYFTTHKTFFLVPLDDYDEEIRKIDFLLCILEKSKVGDIIKKSNYKNEKLGRNSYNPYNLFSAIIFCFAFKKGTLRDIEEMCRYDVRLMYLMEQNTPSYKTISEFINEVILPNTYEIFVTITETIITELGLDISDQYVDGTKLEANANKYKFVWKPTKYHANLDKKIREYLLTIDEEYTGNAQIKSHELYSRIENYALRNKVDTVNIPTGKGKRKTYEQKKYSKGFEYLKKLLEYEEKERICGMNRNSYYRTDTDATAMALKTDYYSGHGSNLHAAYNIQFIVSSGIVVFFGTFQDRTDYYTLIPLLEKYKIYYGYFPKNLCADSGYGIFDNYNFLKNNNIGNYIKMLSWNGEAKGSHPQLYLLNENEDGFICIGGYEGVVVPFDSKHHQRQKNTKLYKFTGCNDCGFVYKCKEKMKDKTANFKKAELNLEFETMKDEARKNLLSRKGIEIRVNRSIQAEGAFGQIKQNMGYIRLRRRGLDKVNCEIMLVCLGRNIRKLFSWYGKNKIDSKYWKLDEDIACETFSIINPKM